jgi:hypothetical protein
MHYCGDLVGYWEARGPGGVREDGDGPAWQGAHITDFRHWQRISKNIYIDCNLDHRSQRLVSTDEYARAEFIDALEVNGRDFWSRRCLIRRSRPTGALASLTWVLERLRVVPHHQNTLEMDVLRYRRNTMIEGSCGGLFPGHNLRRGRWRRGRRCSLMSCLGC